MGKSIRVYGLTGGTGGGKSAAAAEFARCGIPVIDADKIGHALIAPGGRAEQAVLNAFGPEIKSCGTIDRERLGRLVFSDPGALQRLNAIVHPALRAEIRRRCKAIRREGHAALMIDAALIAEDGNRDACLDGLVLVSSARENRLRRLMEARGLSREQASQRIDAQTPPEAKAPLADWVIENDGTLDELRRRAAAIAREILYGA